MTKTIEKPEYEIANEAAKALFESLGIESQISVPVGDVKDEWPCILYNVTFSKAGRNLTTEYRLGVGHVNWKKAAPSRLDYCRLTPDEEMAVYTLQRNPSARLKDKSLWASTAAKLAKIQKVAPAPFEVLAAICDDGMSAHGESFDNYASNFGMDSDSIKARRVYDTCCELYHKAVAFIGADNVAKFAEMHRQF